MSRSRKRVTVRYKPTGAGKTMVRMIGVIHAVIGTVFFLVGLSFLHHMWLFGLIFAAVGGLFAVNGTLIALGKEGFMGRSYQIETETEGDGETEPTDHPTGGSNPAPQQPSVEQRLKQLEDLREKRLITANEFEEKRKEILKEL